MAERTKEGWRGGVKPYILYTERVGGENNSSRKKAVLSNLHERIMSSEEARPHSIL
jgi:hypothetical protein